MDGDALGMTYRDAVLRDMERLGIPSKYFDEIWDKYCMFMFSIYVEKSRKPEDFFYSVVR